METAMLYAAITATLIPLLAVLLLIGYSAAGRAFRNEFDRISGTGDHKRLPRPGALNMGGSLRMSSDSEASAQRKPQ